VSRLALVGVATCMLGMVCALATALFIFVREWRWNRDRRRRVTAMLHQEQAIDEAEALLVHQMAAQLEEIRTLPEVFKPVG
jgi:hypothetical protein